MPDKSHLDQKYFIDNRAYNCPFCNLRHTAYDNLGRTEFNWSTNKKCGIWIVVCRSCGKKSMHLTHKDLKDYGYSGNRFRNDIDLDESIFYSVPTSFFVIDNRIPKIIRELITEGEGCIKMNYLTGASACCRKAIYELTITEKAEGDDYEGRIKFLKGKHRHIDPTLFDVLCRIQDMTSEKVHEQSWDKWDSEHLKLFLETLKAILHEIYVIPDEKRQRKQKVTEIYERIHKDKKTDS
jgi:hypothetical protein